MERESYKGREKKNVLGLSFSELTFSFTILFA